MPETEPIDVNEWEKFMSPLADTSIVIMSVTVLEDWVASAIKTKMRSLGNTMDERLFRGYGPLSTFAAKIDIGYALNLFGQETHNDLRALKDIRNAFAHTPDPLFFRSTQLAPLFQKLKGWTTKAHPHQLFRDRVHDCVEALKVPLQQRTLIDALMKRASKTSHLSSHEKSEKPSPRHLPRSQGDNDIDE